MESLSTEVIVVSEIALIVIASLSFAVHWFYKRYKRQQDLIDKLQLLLQKELLKQIQSKAEGKANAKTAEPVVERGNTEEICEEPQDNLLEKLETCEKRIHNLENFKRLFFGLESKVGELGGSAMNQIEEVIQALSAGDGALDDRLFDKLKKSLEQMKLLMVDGDLTSLKLMKGERESKQLMGTMNSQMEHMNNGVVLQKNILVDMRKKEEFKSGSNLEDLNRLEILLKKSESQVATLKKQLVALQDQASYSDMNSSRIKNLKSRVKILEQRERELSKTITELRTALPDDSIEKGEIIDFPELDPTNMDTYKEFSETVAEKELQLNKAKQELKVLEHEYESLFNNYESLLQKHTGGAVNVNDALDPKLIPSENMEELVTIKNELESKKMLLDRKDLECKMLEENYLDLVQTTDTLQEACEELGRVKVEYDMLKEQLDAMESNPSTEQESNAIQNYDEDKAIKRYVALERKYSKVQAELAIFKEKEPEHEKLQKEFIVLEKKLADMYEQKYMQ